MADSERTGDSPNTKTTGRFRTWLRKLGSDMAAGDAARRADRTFAPQVRRSGQHSPRRSA